MNNRVYHGSPLGGLKTIKPKISSHGKPWVYATQNPVLALVFMAPWNDLILNLAYGEDGLLELTERYPGAFRQVFEHKSGYLYALDGKGFVENQTGFTGEVVSPYETKTVEEIFYRDVYTALLEAEKNRGLRIRCYPSRHPDIPVDDSDLVTLVLRVYQDTGEKAFGVKCKKLHPHLIQALEEKGL